MATLNRYPSAIYFLYEKSGAPLLSCNGTMRCLSSGLKRNEANKRQTGQRKVDVGQKQLPFLTNHHLAASNLATSSREAIFGVESRRLLIASSSSSSIATSKLLPATVVVAPVSDSVSIGGDWKVLLKKGVLVKKGVIVLPSAYTWREIIFSYGI